MTFEEQLLALGKNRKHVLKRLKELFPFDDCKESYPDKDHEWFVGMHLNTAWHRAGSWEFKTVLDARFNYNHWLAPWYQSYIGGLPDPSGIFTWQWVHGQWHYNFKNIQTSEIAREWAEGALGLRPITNGMRFRGYDLSDNSEK